MSTDSQIEQEIQDKGLTAPRVTQMSIESAIAGIYYFRASDGVEHADRAACSDLAHWQSLRLLTVCVIVMRNGFTVMGKSACASPENFDEELGRNIARQDAVNQIWPLEGYLLKSRLAAG